MVGKGIENLKDNTSKSNICDSHLLQNYYGWCSIKIPELAVLFLKGICYLSTDLEIVLYKKSIIINMQLDFFFTIYFISITLYQSHLQEDTEVHEEMSYKLI